MPPKSQEQRELRFTTTSNVGHELIHSVEDMDKILNACYHQCKTQYKKLKLFVEECKYDYGSDGV